MIKLLKPQYWIIASYYLSIVTLHAHTQTPWQFSLLYSADERDNVYKQRLKQGNQRTQQPSNFVDNHVLYLNGVAYIDNHHWSLWLNNQMIDINHPYPGIDIMQVTSDSITFKVKKTGTAEDASIYTLRINQSIDIRTDVCKQQP